MKDLIILGAGPAGLAAAIYGMRAGLDLLVLEKFSPGGQVVNTYEVENYPGFAEPVPGWDLVSAMENQARRLGTEFATGEALEVTRDDTTFTIRLADGEPLQARTVIAATGAALKKLGVPGEEQFFGRGVSYCATCDAAFYRDRVTAVIGGGDTALEEAHYLTRFASKVHLIHRRNEFRGAKVLQDRVLASEKIVPVLGKVAVSVNGQSKVESITVKDVNSGNESVIPVDGVFVFIGYTPNTSYLSPTLLNKAGEVIVDMQMRTSIP
ncbi:MAG TPA: FAD-dependent oxidoreductase, partial [Spirochaetota bacterium]|nr:FAD-dependent oxidoreductase [Spirochaetota bacterium]